MTSYVTTLHNRLGKNGEEKHISYLETSGGPEHAPVWTTQCKIKGEVKGTGTGSSKAQAKEEASKQALEALGLLD